LTGIVQMTMWQVSNDLTLTGLAAGESVLEL
jgi:hypothetical protein